MTNTVTSALHNAHAMVCQCWFYASCCEGYADLTRPCYILAVTEPEIGTVPE